MYTNILIAVLSNISIVVLNKTSKIVLTGFMIALLSTGFPSIMIQDAYAAANITFTAETTTKTTITVTFSEVVSSSPTTPPSTAAWTISTGQTVSSVTHTNGTATMTLNLGSQLNESARPTVTYAENASISDDGAGTNTPVVGGVVATDGITDSSSKCYDCIAPKVKGAQITISSDNYIITTGDKPIHITANVGDEISLVLKITDNRSTDTIPFVGLYTNFIEKPSDMSLFYANNYDNLKNISTSFYEWNLRSDDVAYDYDGTVSWSNGMPTVANDSMIGEYLMVPFTMKFTDSMDTSQITIKSFDAFGNSLYNVLPVTLEVVGDTLEFDSNGKVLGFFNESVLSIMLSELNGSEDTAPLSALLGIPDESLPPWTLDLATWVAEDKIDSADLIVAVEYLIS
jgi:hypothetical protein